MKNLYNYIVEKFSNDLHDELLKEIINQICSKDGIEVKDSSKIYNNGKIIKPEEYEMLYFPQPIKLKINGDNMDCDGIMVFGDLTIEFHDKENEDAYNWGEFDNESIKKVIDELKKNKNLRMEH